MPGGGLDHLGQRPVGDAFSVGQAAAAEHGRALEAADELARQAALPHARLAVDRDQVRAPVAGDALERVGEQVELGVASDQGRDDAGVRQRLGAVGGADDAPGLNRLAAPRERDRAGLLDVDRPGGQAARGRADQDLARAAACWRRAARFTASPVANVESAVSTTTSPDSIPIRACSSRPSTARRMPRPARIAALRVVLVRLGDAEGGENRVAGELLDDPAMRGHAVRDLVEEPGHAAAHDLRVGAGDELGRADQVDEEHGCKLAFHH